MQPGKGTHIRRSQQPFLSRRWSRAPLPLDRIKPLEVLAAEALEFKDGQKGRCRWRGTFLYEKYGWMNFSQLRSKRKELTYAINHRWKYGPGRSRRLEASSSTLRQSRPLDLAAFSFGVAKSGLHTKTRCRDNIGKWRPSADIDAELWCWFVDRLEKNKTRVSGREILNEATQYANAIRTAWRLDCENGLASPDKPPRLPKINMGYVGRWRIRYGVPGYRWMKVQRLSLQR